MSNPIDNVTDFLKFKKDRAQLTGLLKSADLRALGVSELGTLVETLGRVLEKQSELLDSVLTDTASLAGSVSDMQERFILISGQAFLALHILKEKGVTSPEEVHALWEEIIKPKLQETTEEPVQEIVTDSISEQE